MLALLALVLLIAGTMTVSKWADAHSEDSIYTASDIPNAKVGLVLGCSRYLSDGRENLFFQYRIAKAVELYQSGKVDYLLVSGDNSRVDYDEPTEMMEALAEHGVPGERVVRDYAGFSTLDSIVRAKEVFGQEKLIVVSQEFHVRRAICIGKSRGVEVLGVVARDVSGHDGTTTRIREYLARVKMVLDLYVLHRGPKFLGDAVIIGE